MKDWQNYLDKHGLVVQSNGDGGDSCARTFAKCYLDEQYLVFYTYFRLVNSEKLGLLRRSPHEGMWYADWDRLSRDQLIPALVCLSDKPLKDIFKRHLRRLCLFTWNTRRNFQYPTLEEHLAKSTPDVKWNYGWKVPDFCGPEIWGLYVRGFKAWWARPILWLADLELLIASISIRIQWTKSDVMNHTLSLHKANTVMPTWLSRLAKLITPYELLCKRLDRFFAPEYEPPLNELARKFLLK